MPSEAPPRPSSLLRLTPPRAAGSRSCSCSCSDSNTGSSPVGIVAGVSLMGFIEGARENHVKKKVEEALRSKMKDKALKECDALTRQYAECAAGRTISVVWKCRRQAKELNECLHQYTNDNVLEEMKKSYLQEQESKVPA